MEETIYVEPSEQGVVLKLVESYINEIKALDEHIRYDRSGATGWVSYDRHVWYSHICGGGGYYFAFSIHVPNQKANVRIIPSTTTKLFGQDFSIADPEGRDIKILMRKLLDMVKKEQNRRPWPEWKEASV